MQLDHFQELSVEDQQQYFGKTYFKLTYPNSKGKIWASCAGFINQNVAKFDLGNGQGIQAVSLVVMPPDFTFPEPGLYNLGNTTIYFSRTPRRQSKKGLCADTAEMRSFAGILRDNKGQFILSWRPNDPWRIKAIQELFGNTFEYTLHDALQIFKKKRPISFALDREFAISLGIKSKYLSLWYKQVLVGEIPKPTEIKLLPSLFKQEVVDHFHEEGVQISD